MLIITCPLCGRHSEGNHWDSHVSDDQFEIENQITNLDRVLEQLTSGQGAVISYIENRETMCPMCQRLTEGINDESERGEFVRRLDNRIQKLDEREEGDEEPSAASVIEETGERDADLMEFEEEAGLELQDGFDEENL